jgi:hypothetical protein
VFQKWPKLHPLLETLGNRTLLEPSSTHCKMTLYQTQQPTLCVQEVWTAGILKMCAKHPKSVPLGCLENRASMLAIFERYLGKTSWESRGKPNIALVLLVVYAPVRLQCSLELQPPSDHVQEPLKLYSDQHPPQHVTTASDKEQANRLTRTPTLALTFTLIPAHPLTRTVAALSIDP